MNKEIIGNVVTAVVTAAILGILGWALGVFNAGSDALSEDQIEAVIKRTLILDNGDTYATTLSSINIRLGSIDTSLVFIKDDVDDLEDLVGILAGE